MINSTDNLISHTFSLIMYNIQSIIITMDSDSNQFLKIANRAATLSDFHQVVEDQEARMDLLSFQIHSLLPEKAIKTYKRVLDKYAAPNGQAIQAQTWLESQKRLFAWFITFYTYFNRHHAPLNENIDFTPLAPSLFNKDPDFLLFHYLVLLKSSERMSWSQQRDQLLLEAIKVEGMRWNDVSRNIFMRTNKMVFKSPKSCRERWLNHLDNTKVKGNWSDEEDIAILQYIVETSTKKWSKMVPLLDNKRTQHSIKNRFNMLVAKHRRYKTQKDLKVAVRLLTNLQAKTGNKNESQHEEQGRQEVVQQNCYEQSHLQSNQCREGNANDAMEKIKQDEPVIEKPQPVNEVAIKEQEGVQAIIPNNPVEVVQRENFPQGYYPFENYSYEQDLNNFAPQFYDFRTPVYYYQPIFTLTLPTADTQNRENRIAQDRRQRRQPNNNNHFDHRQ